MKESCACRICQLKVRYLQIRPGFGGLLSRKIIHPCRLEFVSSNVVNNFFYEKVQLYIYFITFTPENYFTMNKNSFIYRAFDLYYDGFKHMTVGKTLWAVILIKLFIMFAILKVFFFPDFIKQNTQKGDEAEFVSTEMIKRNIH